MFSMCREEMGETEGVTETVYPGERKICERDEGAEG